MAVTGSNPPVSNYTPASPNIPDLTFTAPTAGNAAEFAYTVNASNTTEIDTTFRDDNANCGATGSEGLVDCWYNASTTDGSTPIAEQIIVTTGATESSGSTSSVAFRVAVPSNPSPALPAGTYIATATLTATTN